MNPQEFYFVMTSLVVGGLTTLGIAAFLGVIAFFRILLGGGTVRGYPYALFAIFWSGAVGLVTFVALAALTYRTDPDRNRPASEVSPPVNSVTSHAAFTVDLGAMEFVRETDPHARVAKFVADLAQSLHELRSQLELEQEHVVKFDIGILETSADSDLFTFQLSTQERNEASFKSVALRVKELVRQKLDDAFLKDCKARTWSVAYEVVWYD